MNEAILHLSDLRDIAWEVWDPIGLGGEPADEYDSYLLQLAGRIRNGADDIACADYLVSVEADAMGLGDSHGAHDRALKTVALVRAHLATLPPGRLRIR